MCNELGPHPSVVAVYGCHEHAAGALSALSNAGLDVNRLSTVGEDFETEDHLLGDYAPSETRKFWCGRGALWGSVAVGPLLVTGPLVGWLVCALEHGDGRNTRGVLSLALARLGVPPSCAEAYADEIAAGRALIHAQGGAELMGKTRAVLDTTGAAYVGAHPGRDLHDGDLRVRENHAPYMGI